MSLWTITAHDYGNTGEGCTMVGLITLANDPDDAMKRFREAYRPMYGEKYVEVLTSIAVVDEGVVAPFMSVAAAIFSEQTLTFCRNNEAQTDPLKKANIKMMACVYYNYS